MRRWNLLGFLRGHCSFHLSSGCKHRQAISSWVGFMSAQAFPYNFPYMMLIGLTAMPAQIINAFSQSPTSRGRPISFGDRLSKILKWISEGRSCRDTFFRGVWGEASTAATAVAVPLAVTAPISSSGPTAATGREMVETTKARIKLVNS